ncbi:porin, partial [Pseudomonas putida]
IDNKTWSAMFTYTLGGHALLVGHQQIGDDGGFVWLNQGNLTNDSGTSEGAGGSSFYLFTDSMINQFARAGENTTFGQYSYDFASLGVPGLKASVSYLRGDDIRNKSGNGTYNEWERDARVDYTIQEGTLKGLGFSLRQGVYRGAGESSADQDQARFIVNYTYAFM